MIYTANAIDSLDDPLQDVIEPQGRFPDEEAAIKPMFLALRNDAKRSKGVLTFWPRARAQRMAHFGDER